LSRYTSCCRTVTAVACPCPLLDFLNLPDPFGVWPCSFTKPNSERGCEAVNVIANVDNERERQRLYNQRDALLREHRQLEEEAAGLAGTTNRDVLRAHGGRVRTHLKSIRAFTHALHRFHTTVGPLGSPLSDTCAAAPECAAHDARPAPAKMESRSS